MKRSELYICILALLLFCGCQSKSGRDPLPDPGLEPPIEEPAIPTPDPTARLLYNGIELPAKWPPLSNYSSNIFTGMSPDYLKNKPVVINIELGRQLFVDDFLIAETTLERKWYSATYHDANPVLKPEKQWEMGTSGGGFAAPFSDGVWYDETDNKFKMWYMAGGNGQGGVVTCYAESNDGIAWARPELRLVEGTNIVHKSSSRDSYSVWIDKQTSNPNERFKMFAVYGGAGNWKYHYLTSANGTAWRESAASNGALADRSTAFYNPFRGVWVYSMRHNVRINPTLLVRARDYYESPDPKQGTTNAKADLKDFWFGPWPDEPRHTKPEYDYEQPAIYNLDAIAYESLMLGLFSVWSGPENDVSAATGEVKQNQILLGFSRDGWSWSRENFTPFCPTSTTESDWNYGNIQSACGSPIIVGDKLYFYMSGRRMGNTRKEIVTTGLATLRRDGFASMSGTGVLTTEVLKFKGEHLYLNSKGAISVELLDERGDVIEGYDKQSCKALSADSTKQKIEWAAKSDLSELKGRNIKLRFHLEEADLFAFWISQAEDGRSYGYTAGGGEGLNKYGIDM